MLPAQTFADAPAFGGTAVAPPVKGGPILRALLTSDGSITLLLEAFFGEKIVVTKLLQREVSFETDQPLLQAPSGSRGIERTVLLRGSISQRTYLHARSIIAVNNLSPDLKESLVATDDPIGKLWARHRIETFKKILSFKKRPANELAQHFKVPEQAQLISRTYQVFSDRKCVMLIEETFTEDLDS